MNLTLRMKVDWIAVLITHFRTCHPPCNCRSTFRFRRSRIRKMTFRVIAPWQLMSFTWKLDRKYLYGSHVSKTIISWPLRFESPG